MLETKSWSMRLKDIEPSARVTPFTRSISLSAASSTAIWRSTGMRKGSFRNGFCQVSTCGFSGASATSARLARADDLAMATASAAQGLNACAREAIGRGEAPGAAGDHADANAECFGFNKRADFAIFGADFALADVHHARVGVGGSAELGRFDGPGGPVLHHARGAPSLGTRLLAIFLQSGGVW